MDKSRLGMANSFQADVKNILMHFFTTNDFFYDKTIESDIGNKVVVFYHSFLCRLGIYKSSRDGEVNCMIGMHNAEIINFGENGWYFFNDLNPNKRELTIEELLKAVPDSPKTSIEQLDELKKNLIDNYSDVLHKLLQLRFMGQISINGVW